MAALAPGTDSIHLAVRRAEAPEQVDDPSVLLTGVPLPTETAPKVAAVMKNTRAMLEPVNTRKIELSEAPMASACAVREERERTS